MILESIKSAPAKVIHVFNLSQCNGKLSPDGNFDSRNEYKIGRSIETDMKIADISVSRVHSYIRCIGDQLILDDNGSKFGTLVKIMKPYPILRIRHDSLDKDESKFYFQSSIFQIGRSMIYFKFYDQQSHLVPRQNDHVRDYTIDPDDINLSYIPWKGTTFNRKTTV